MESMRPVTLKSLKLTANGPAKNGGNPKRKPGPSSSPINFQGPGLLLTCLLLSFEGGFFGGNDSNLSLKKESKSIRIEGSNSDPEDRNLNIILEF